MSSFVAPGPRVSNRLRLLPRCLALLALLTSAAVASAADDIPDPCKLATAAEVQAVLGSPVTATGMRPPARHGDTPARICSFQGQNGKSMNIYIGPRTKAQFSREGAGMEAVAGVGEAAYTVPPGILSFLKGPMSVAVQAINFDPSDATPAFKAKLKTLAVAVANRL